MNNYDKIIEIAKNNNGYINISQLKGYGIDHKFLYNLVKKDTFEKVSHGLYILKNELNDEYYNLQYKSKYVVFSHSTALYFHNLSDRIPLIIDITVPYHYNGSLQKNRNVRLNYVKEDIWELGIINTKTILDNYVKIYDIEKTICDIIKDRDKMDSEIFTRALRKYANMKNKDIVKLIKYAKNLNIEEKVRKYMEVLL